MKKLFSLPFQHKVFLVLLLFMNVPFLITGYMAKNLAETFMLKEKEAKLIAMAHVLNTRLDQGGYDALLKERGTEHGSREEKVAVLNQALSAVTDEVIASLPGLGAGFYSRSLDAIITYGPSSSFGKNVGLAIKPDHPGHDVMRTNTPLIRLGTMVRGNILNAMVPIERGGQVIGYTWANEEITDISAQMSAMFHNFFLVMATCFVLTFILLLLLSRRTVRDIGRIINGLRAMRSDFSQRIASSRGELGEVVNSINEMAEGIARANEETGRAVAVLQSVMSNVDVIVYVCDPQSKRLVYTNEYLRRMQGRNDLEGQLCYEVLRNRSEPCPFCPQKQLLDGEDEPEHAIVRWEMHDKERHRDFLITDRLVTWHDGRLLHMELSTDVTERKALVMAEAANLAQREFLARMSHEIRTPMNGVLGMVRLAMRADPPPAQMEYLKKIQSSASLLLGIINDILDFSRIEAGKLSIEKRAFSPHDLVENIRELILPRIAEKDLEFSVSISPSVPEYVVGDDLRLSQVLLNLLGNASKFTFRGSIALNINAETLPSGKICLCCEVRDTGIGMSEEERRALFKPFSQADVSTSRRFGGSGLGLSISKALVELMGGLIDVHSEPGRGSVFSFSVQLEPFSGTFNRSGEKENIWNTMRYDGHTFLLVEDNTINQEIALALLHETGATVETAVNGEEAVRAFQEKEYAVIFMDVRMPVMDGLEATRRIRASGKHGAATIPIIAMTANAMQEDREATKEAGMNGHIAKPIDVDELAKVLHQVLPLQEDGKIASF